MRCSTLALPFAIGVQLSTANSLASPTPPSLHKVSADAVAELMIATDFSAIDATKWSAFLDQPHDVLAAWDPKIKHRMFPVLHNLLDFGTGLEKRDPSPAQARIEIVTKKNILDAEVDTDEAKDKLVSKCAHSALCVICVTGAASIGIGGIAGCATLALAAEALTAPETAELSTAGVVTGFVECSAVPFGKFLSVTAGCLIGQYSLGG